MIQSAKTYTIYFNGKYFKVDPKILEVFTPGEFVGQGAFETLLAIGHKVFDTKEHLKRLSKGVRGCKATSAIIQKVVEANGFDMSRVRILAWKESGQNHTLIMALPYQAPSKEVYNVCLMKTSRLASVKNANNKSLDYKFFYDAYTKAKSKGFDEVVLLNRRGHAFEASRGNLFIVLKDILVTPPLSSGCLNGITRGQIIQAARKMRLSVVEENITLPMLRKAKEAFMTNSLVRIKPIKISFTFLPR